MVSLGRGTIGSAARRGPTAAGIVIGVLALTLLLCGCGKKGPLVPPPGQPNTYPRAYPSE